jgi:hypothetical protein
MGSKLTAKKISEICVFKIKSELSKKKAESVCSSTFTLFISELPFDFCISEFVNDLKSNFNSAEISYYEDYPVYKFCVNIIKYTHSLN